jgi:hypothetical protein
MEVTRTMIAAARQAERDYYERGRELGSDHYSETPMPVLRAMLNAALAEAYEQSRGGRSDRKQRTLPLRRAART